MEKNGLSQLSEKQWLVADPVNPNRVTVSLEPHMRAEIEAHARRKGFMREGKPQPGRLLTMLTHCMWPLLSELNFDRERLQQWLDGHLPHTEKRFRKG